MTCYEWQGNDLIIRIRVQPRASHDDFAEMLDDRIKLRLTAAPVDGKANAHMKKYLARLFRVPRGRIEIINGETGRNKRVRITDPQRLPDFIQRQ